MKAKNNKPSGRAFDFTLILTGITELPRRVEDALFEAGCDDATPSVRFGRVCLTFSRIAPTLKDAILTALRDVKQADTGADVLRVDIGEFVTQADIARQLVHQSITGQRGPKGFRPRLARSRTSRHSGPGMRSRTGFGRMT